MYCPACGADAGASKFCPECGADLRALAGPPACVACGAELPEGAKFCPECGTASAAADASSPSVPEESPAPAAASTGGGRRTGTRGKSAGAGQQRREAPAAAPAAKKSGGRPAPAAQPARRLSPVLIWGGFAALAAVVIVVVVLVSGGIGGSSSAGTASGSPTPVVADTQGSYNELVLRANGLYDQGAAEFDAKRYAQGGVFYAAAATVYEAAWKQQSTDPGVGTDFATALFYSGKVDEAIAQIDKVLAQAPKFQTAWFNKGNYLAEKGRAAGQAGNAKVSKKAYADARAAYQRAIDLGATTRTGQQAQAQLDKLPQ